MAQKIFINWKDGLDSFSVSQMLNGIFPQGRICGFDNMVSVSGLTFSIDHASTGVTQTDVNVNPSNKTGILMTKQGMIVQEDATITGLSCVTNAGNATIRTDILVFSHQKVNTPGGTAGTYIIVQGPGNDPTPPTPPLPNKQVIVGYISIPPSASNLSGATYTPAQVGLIGGVNIFTNFPELKQTFGQLNTTNFWSYKQGYDIGTNITTSSNRWTVPTDGQIFKNLTNQTMDEIIGTTGDIIHIYGQSNVLTITFNVTPSGGGRRIRCMPLENRGITSITLRAKDAAMLVASIGAEYNLIVSGEIMDRHRVYAAANQNANVAISGAAGSVLQFPQADGDPLSLLSSTNSVFTAPAKGRYRVQMGLRGYVTATGGGQFYYYVGIRKGGVLIRSIASANTESSGAGTYYISSQGCYSIDLAAGDTIDLYFVPIFSGGINYNIVANDTWWQITQEGTNP